MVAARSWAASIWLMAAVARLSAALRARTAVRSGSPTRIHPTRSPPHSSFETELTAAMRRSSRVATLLAAGRAAHEGRPTT